MKIKLKLTKTEKVMALLDQWDPDGRRRQGAGFMAYSYEADTIAQELRSNSKIETIERYIMEAFADTPLDADQVHQMAVYIKNAVRK